MPDTKITALAAIVTVDPAVDVLPIVDVSDTSMAASGTTKKITSNQLLGAGGTATLASATITGDLTVDTSTLKVDSANNRVGIGTASPASPLDVYGETRVRSGNQLRLYRADNVIYSSFEDAGGGVGLTINNANGDGFLLKVQSNDVYRINASYIQTWYDGAGGTRMTLNSTGLGVGVTPSGAGGCLQLKSGITFPATQVASSDANTLDDYEEGTWTPIIVGQSTAGTGTYGSQVGRYTKVGNLVTVQCLLSWTAHTGTGSMILGGLPFTSSGVSSLVGAAAFGYVDGLALAANNIPLIYVLNASTSMAFVQTPVGGGSVSLVSVDSAATVVVTATYMV